jgi:hypothetical protein
MDLPAMGGKKDGFLTWNAISNEKIKSIRFS